MDRAITQRQDLISARSQLQGYHYSYLLTERRAGPTFAADVNFDKTLTPTSLEARAFTLSLNGPFFDGGLARSEARAAKFVYLAAQARYTQQERQARAEIEAAYEAAFQNEQTVVAAKSAREAAQSNYQASVESQKVGASNLIDVITAQVSLITAESNYIQALYDTILSSAKLDLVLGRPMPGEKA